MVLFFGEEAWCCLDQIFTSKIIVMRICIASMVQRNSMMDIVEDRLLSLAFTATPVMASRSHLVAISIEAMIATESRALHLMFM